MYPEGTDRVHKYYQYLETFQLILKDTDRQYIYKKEQKLLRQSTLWFLLPLLMQFDKTKL